MALLNTRFPIQAFLDFDANNGQIIPKREGNAVITAILLDNRGAIIDDCNCNVTILPPKDVITPDGALVLLIVSLIGSLLLCIMNVSFFAEYQV